MRTRIKNESRILPILPFGLVAALFLIGTGLSIHRLVGSTQASTATGYRLLPTPTVTSFGSIQQASKDDAFFVTDLHTERSGHAATELASGGLLITGGENQSGYLQSSETFNLEAKSFSPGPFLLDARADHSATRLADGRILVTGGHNATGPLTASEIYDPVADRFIPGPTLNRARTGQTATLLTDGRVLIAGGDDEGSAEVFDPRSGLIHLLPARLTAAISFHAAVRLKNGSILLTGGRDAKGEAVRSAQLFDPVTGAFAPASSLMRAARVRPLLRVLPDGKVQVVGGDMEASMEMFNDVGRYFTACSRFRDVSLPMGELLILESHLDMDNRTHHSITEAASFALIAGGRRSDGRFLKSAGVYTTSSATVTTDKTDYAPGEVVTITGSNWLPGETIRLVLYEEPATHPEIVLWAQADENGNFTNRDFSPNDGDLGVTFTLVATGQTSGFTATTTFTDGNIKIFAAPSGVSYTLVTTIYTSTTCMGTIKPGTPGNPNPDTKTVTFETEQTYGVGNTESITLEAAPFSDQGGAFLNWTSSSSFTVIGGGGRIICVPGFTGGGSRDYTANYVVAACSITCPANISTVADAGQCTAVVNYPAPTTGGGCGTITCTPASGSAFPIGTTTVSCANAGGTPACSFSVTVADAQAPTIACPADITAAMAPNACTATVTFSPTASDNCALPANAVVCTPPSGASYPQGVTTVNCSVTDGAGLTASCSFTVTVNDTEVPQISCPSNITTPTDPGLCTAVVTYSPTASDNCTLPNQSIVCSPLSGTAFAKGVTSVNCTVTDAANNTNSCSFTVTVTDTQAPTVACPSDISVSGSGCQVVSYATPAGSDNCSGVGVTCTPPSGSCFAAGATTVTCVATDAANNTGSCTFTVTVNSCTLTCPGDVSQNTDAGQCTAVVNYPAPTTGGGCGTITCTPASGSAFPIGTTTVSCANAGGTPACSFSVTVADAQAPTIACPADITAAMAPNACTATVNFTAPTASDNCSGIGQVTCTPASGSSFPVGATTVSCSVTDAANNNASCSFAVTINDEQTPVLTSPPDVTENTDPGQCTAVVTYPAPTTSDNCSGVGTPSCNPPSGSAFPAGTTTVNCSVSDASGNSANSSFSVTVTDAQAPTVACPSDISVSGSGCQVVSYATPAGSDNCSGVGVTCTPPSGSCFAAGATTVTCVATDAAKNSSTCTFSVTVTPCTITAPGNITVANDLNQCGAAVNYPAPATTGSCGSAVCMPPSGSFFPVGTTTVTCSLPSGPSASFTVTVIDAQAPTFSYPTGITAVTSACGGVSQVVTYPLPTVTDNCPVVDAPQCSPAPGSIFPVGSTTVTCTYNSETFSFAVTVFNAIVQDDSNPNTVLMWDTFSGNYVFCCGGTTYTGKGTVISKGSIHSLSHNATTYRVTGEVDCAVRRGKGGLQLPPGSSLCSIADRNTSNNTISCPAPPSSL